MDLPSMPQGAGTGLKYESLKEKYGNFELPQAEIDLNGNVFDDKEGTILINDISIENTSGFEASVARFRIFNVFDAETGEFRYEPLKKALHMGASLEIRLGYLGSLEPAFVGFVAGIDFCYDPDDTAYIEVTGMDVKGIMMANSYCTQLKAKSYGEAVEEILKKTAYEKLKTGNAIIDIKVSDTPDKKQGQGGGDKASAETIEMVSESDYEFVVKAAKKFNYEFFVDRGVVYFRKAKSEKTPLTELSAGKGIVRFDIGYSITGVVGNIEARAMDPGTGKLISSKAKLTNNLSVASKAKGLVSKSGRIYIDPSISSKEQADARVEYLKELMSYRLGSLECECVGIPELVPGRFVKITGFGKPVDNTFYITDVVHSFQRDTGYRTKITGKAAEVVK